MRTAPPPGARQAGDERHDHDGVDRAGGAARARRHRRGGERETGQWQKGHAEQRAQREAGDPVEAPPGSEGQEEQGVARQQQRDRQDDGGSHGGVGHEQGARERARGERRRQDLDGRARAHDGDSATTGGRPAADRYSAKSKR